MEKLAQHRAWAPGDQHDPKSPWPNWGWTETDSESKGLHPLSTPSIPVPTSLFLRTRLQGGRARLSLGTAQAWPLTHRGGPYYCPHLLTLSQATDASHTKPDPVVSDQGHTPANGLVEVFLGLILQQDRWWVSVGGHRDPSLPSSNRGTWQTAQGDAWQGQSRRLGCSEPSPREPHSSQETCRLKGRGMKNTPWCSCRDHQ